MKKIIAIIIIIILLLGFCWYGFKIWWPKKQLSIQLGLASPNFPWRNYTQEELKKMYPQIKYADVPTRATPEETYAKFREALRTNNLELALEQLSKESGRYEENKNDLMEAYKNNSFSEVYNNYPEKIIKESIYESFAQYSFDYKEGVQERRHFLNFSKDANGDWKMDSL